MLYKRLDPWCSSPPLQEVGDVSETSHRRCSLMERDDLGEPKLQWPSAPIADGELCGFRFLSALTL